MQLNKDTLYFFTWQKNIGKKIMHFGTIKYGTPIAEQNAATNSQHGHVLHNLFDKQQL